MFRIKIGKHVKDDEFLDFMKKKYKKELTEAALDRRYVHTYGMNQTGKTDALVEFAKENGYNVIVSTYSKARELRIKFDYKKIYHKKSYEYVPHSQIAVVDEDVKFTRPNDVPFRIITGYSTMTPSEELKQAYNFGGRPDWW